MGHATKTAAKGAATSKNTQSDTKTKAKGAKAETAPTKATKPKGAKAKAGGGKAKLIARTVAEKQARLLAEGRADVELIKRRRARIAEDFYDIGEALARLKRPGVAQAMGHASFGALCQTELGMSAAKASYLIAIVTHVPRADATRLGQDRTVALLQLADATPEADAPVDLAKGVLKLPGGDELHLAKASAQEIRDAAKAIRASGKKGGSPATRRGRSATPEERDVASKLQARLRSLGAEHATVMAVATKPGQPSVVRIDRLRIDQLTLLKKAL